jgi:hypothetical protein
MWPTNFCRNFRTGPGCPVLHNPVDLREDVVDPVLGELQVDEVQNKGITLDNRLASLPPAARLSGETGWL